MRIALLTVLALTGFAANSLLCRAALGDAEIDAATFTAVRLLSGAVALSLLLRSRTPWRGGSHGSAFALFAYAILFSFAYVRLTTGTGALLLFGAVQLTMLSRARPKPVQWLGLVLAFAGIVVLVAPGVRAPDPIAAMLMAIAGVAWGVYSLRGRGTASPLGDTTGNFVRGAPLALVCVLVMGSVESTARGLVLATASGALASGVGYALWYAALPKLGATRAAVVQLSVPVIAAAGGIALLNEPLTQRLAVSSLAVLGGIALATQTRSR